MTVELTLILAYFTEKCTDKQWNGVNRWIELSTSLFRLTTTNFSQITVCGMQMSNHFIDNSNRLQSNIKTFGSQPLAPQIQIRSYKWFYFVIRVIEWIANVDLNATCLHIYIWKFMFHVQFSNSPDSETCTEQITNSI